MTAASLQEPSRHVAADLRHVTLCYENGVQALRDLSLSVAWGEHLCVLGANGSGKSTLASVLCGLLAPDAGEVRLLGERVYSDSAATPVDYEAYRRARRQLGLVFQNPDDQIVTTVVEEDVAFGPENLGVPAEEIGMRVERELKRVAMTAYAKADPTRLSGGQKQRIAIAGALAMEPKVIVFDEPGSLLDVRGRLAIVRVMRRLRKGGTTIVHITHFMDEALEADRVVVLDHGHITREGTPAEVFAHGDELQSLGLEEPFVARLSRGLGLPWTCDEDQLMATLMARGKAGAVVCDAAAPGTNAASDVRTHRAGPASHGDPASRSLAKDLHASCDAVPTAINPIMRAHHVSFAYRKDVWALNDVSFVVAQGASTAIVGQTGSGKSTLLRLLCALEAPDAGEILVGDVSTRKKRDRRRLHGAIGYVMQHPERQLFAETVFEDVAFGPTNLGLRPDEVERRCRYALDLVGLRGVDDASPFELSGGQQRLCAIAGILAMEPRILVLDEPTAGLDPRGRRELRSILNGVHERGVTVVQVTHAMEDAARVEQVIVLDQARVMLAGTPEQVFLPTHAQRLERAGLGLPLPLTWALRLEEAGFGHLGNPLTFDALVAAVRRILSAGEVV